jgi:4-amino-4-deoxy-L-arabinose transferase-like glycosyltransferase
VAPVALFLTALLVRAIVAAGYPDPAYPDSFYYANLARHLAAGGGFQIDYIWNFVEVGGRLPAQPQLPIPSNAHWMPLAALVQVPFIWVLGATPLAAGLPFWLIGATAAPITYWIGRDAGLGNRASFAAGLLAAAPGLLTQFMSQPDNFALYMPLGALALWACGRGLRGDRRAFALGGVAVGLATLSRNDGVLLGVPFALAFAVERWSAWRARRAADAQERAADSRVGVGSESGLRAAGTIGWKAAIACAGAFLIVTAPWYLRQLVVFGSLSPSAENGRILWIRSYGELYSASGETTIQTFLGQGPAALLSSRVGGLSMALIIFAGLPLLLYLVPFTGLGAWLRRDDPMFVPWIAYAATLFAFSGLLFAIHVPFGTFLHSAVALVPHAYLLAAAGIAAAIGWVAARRPHWNARVATRNFTAAAVVVAAIGAAGATWRGESNWREEERMRAPIFAALASAPSSDRVMSPDAGAYRYHAGRAGVVTPNDPLPIVEQALRGYDIRWLVLERDHLVPSLEPLLAGTIRPGWLSPPRVVVPGGADAQASTASGQERTMPAAALYAVCLDQTDGRCAP